MTIQQNTAQSVRDIMPEAIEGLTQLARIPSISVSSYPREPIAQAERVVKEQLRAVGFQDVRPLWECSKDFPPIFGEIQGLKGAPCVLLYAHYDIVPPGSEEGWDNPPFEPVERGGRLYGRGVADDKSGIAAHVGTIKAFAGDPPVNVKIIVEGDEETGGSLGDYIPRYPDLFKADVIIICDHGNISVGQPSITASLRGSVGVTLEVKTLRNPVHNGAFGGPVPDALIVLCHIIASFHDVNGNIQIPGLKVSNETNVTIPFDILRNASSLLSGVDLIGDSPLSQQLWSGCAINVIGINAPSIETASNSLIDKTRARVNLRIPPSLDPDFALTCLMKHVQAVTPWGAQVTISDIQTLKGFKADPKGKAYKKALLALRQAYGKEPQIIGDGASIPLTNVLSTCFPQTEIIIWGAEDMAAQVHGLNESVDIAELERVIHAQAVFLQRLAEN